MTQIPDRIDFDPNELTLGEMEDIEEAAGVTFQELIDQFEAQEMRTKSLRAVLWILIRRDNPDYTFEDTRALNVRDLQRLEVEEGDSEVPLENPPSGEAA